MTGLLARLAPHSICIRLLTQHVSSQAIDAVPCITGLPYRQLSSMRNRLASFCGTKMQIDPEVASDKSADGAATEPQPSLREAQKEFTRQRLLDAAEELFESVGYRSATIEEIANRAGANRATFYLHFQGK